MPVFSMTGFAHSQIQTELGLLSIEIKSVNSRYQEVTIRLPEELRYLEGDIRNYLSQYISRGKIDCRMQWVGEAMHKQMINYASVTNLFLLQDEILRDYPTVKPLTVYQILSFPGILQPKSLNSELLRTKVMDTLSQTLKAFLESRIREGEALSKIITEYCSNIAEIVNKLKPKIPEIIKNIQSKLKVRLEEALSQTLTDNSTLTNEEVADRIRQEVILYAIKLDVDEEINRLQTHVNEIRRILAEGGNVGKRLDFMVQELNREANTLGSKASAIEMTQTSLELKVTIEKIREQIQNLE